MSKSLGIKNMQNKFTIEEVQKFWDKVADIYDLANKKFRDTHSQRFLEAIKYLDLKPGMKILNIWSRTGGAIPYLKKKCPDIIIFNLEVSTKFIEIAKKKFPQEKFEETDLKKLEFDNNYFDYILSLETLEHAPDPLLFLRELYRTLKPNGMLIMSCPPSIAELPLKIYDLLFTNHGEGPHKFISSKKVKKILKVAGFKIKFHKGTLLIPLGPDFLKRFGEKIIDKLQKTPIQELGIRQFYICEK